MSGMSANTNNLTVAVLNSSSFSMSGSSSSTTAQCSPMLEGFQLASGSSSSCILYIFPGANVDTPFKYVIAVLGTFLAALCYELLRARREQMTAALQSTSTSTSSSTSLPSSSLPHYDILIAVLYTLQTILGYFLMMLVMTFDIALFVAVSAGLGMGYYWVLRSQRTVAMRKEPMANYKLMQSSPNGMPSTIGTAGFATTPSPTITSAEAC